MVKLIMGLKGSGKTKQLIELINAAAKDEAGNVVCIEPKRDMSYNIHYNIRLIDAQEYDLHSYEMFRGFISGLYAGNYDISQVFIDNLCKTVGSDVDGETVAAFDYQRYKEQQYDKLADALRQSLDMKAIYEMMGLKGVEPWQN